MLSEASAVQLWVTVIATVPATVGALGALIQVNRIKGDVRATKEQVVNDHGDINMREENDDRHKSNQRALRWLGQQMLEVLERMQGVEHRLDRAAGRIQDLEDTERTRRMESRRQRREDSERRQWGPPDYETPGQEGRAPWEGRENEQRSDLR